ncbi:MAG: hypothetical protein Q9187_007984 [Circinaria calcarea]
MQRPSTPPAAYSSPKRKRGDLDLDHTIDFSPSPSRLRTESPLPLLDSETNGEGSPRTVVAGQFSALNIEKEGPMPKLKLELAAKPVFENQTIRKLHGGRSSVENQGKQAPLQSFWPVPPAQIDRLFQVTTAHTPGLDTHELKDRALYDATVADATPNYTGSDERLLMDPRISSGHTSPAFTSADSQDSKGMDLSQECNLPNTPSSAPSNGKGTQEPEVPETPNIQPSSPAPLRLKSPPPLNLPSAGSEAISPDSSFEDLTGVNGIGYRPTPAMAYARAQRRKQQVAEWKSREAREARQRRSERRAGRMGMEKEVGMREAMELQGRKVRFVEG